MSLFRSSKDHPALILDVGNGSVGAGLIVLSSTEKPRIISSFRERIIFEEKPDVEKLKTIIFQKLDQVLPLVLKNAFADPYFKNHPKRLKKILCVLSSPWYMSKGKTVVISQEKKFLITEHFLLDVLSKELAAFENERREDEGTRQAPKRRIIEKDLISMKINGYVLKNPVGQSADHFETSIYMSEAEESFVKKISDIISKHTHVDVNDITFHSFSFVAFSVIGALFPDISEYLHFDIAGEITDIALVKEGMIKSTASYPTGTNLLVRRVADRLSVPPDIARSFFHLFTDKRAEASVEAEIEGALSESEGEWNVYLNDALASLTDGLSSGLIDREDPSKSLGLEVSLPKRVFVTAYPQTYEIFENFLKIPKADETQEWRKGVLITYLGGDLLTKWLTTNPREIFDVFIALEALFFNTFI